MYICIYLYLSHTHLQRKEWTWDENKMMIMQDPIYRSAAALSLSLHIPSVRSERQLMNALWISCFRTNAKCDCIHGTAP